MLEPSSNRHRSPLHALPEPPLWTSRTRDRFVRAILEGGGTVDIYAAPSKRLISLEISYLSAEMVDGPNTRSHIEKGILDAERRLEELKAAYAAYGVGPFLPAVEPQVPPPAVQGDDRQTYMGRWLADLAEAGLQVTMVGGRKVHFDRKSGYTLEELHRDSMPSFAP